jgi:hypothetical protein
MVSDATARSLSKMLNDRMSVRPEPASLWATWPWNFEQRTAQQSASIGTVTQGLVVPDSRAQHVLAHCCGCCRGSYRQREVWQRLDHFRNPGAAALVPAAYASPIHQHDEDKLLFANRTYSGHDQHASLRTGKVAANEQSDFVPDNASDMTAAAARRRGVHSQMYKYLPERPFVGSLLPSARNEATSINAKEPSDVCCRGMRPSSPKHDPTATGRETLAPKQPLTPGCLCVTTVGPAMTVDDRRGLQRAVHGDEKHAFEHCCSCDLAVGAEQRRRTRFRHLGSRYEALGTVLATQGKTSSREEPAHNYCKKPHPLQPRRIIAAPSVLSRSRVGSGGTRSMG